MELMTSEEAVFVQGGQAGNVGPIQWVNVVLNQGSYLAGISAVAANNLGLKAGMVLWSAQDVQTAKKMVEDHDEGLPASVWLRRR